MAVFADRAWFTDAEVTLLLGGIAQLEPAISSWTAEPDLERLAYRLASELARSRAAGLADDPVGVRKEVVLDVAAELTRIAEVLHPQGHYSAAFALEGIAGRMIEALMVVHAPVVMRSDQGLPLSGDALPVQRCRDVGVLLPNAPVAGAAGATSA